MSNTGKWLRIRVTDLGTGESKANVRVPASLAKFGMKMASKYASADLEGLELDQIMQAVKASGETKLVAMEDDQNYQHIEISIE
jgi:hypothetical protein